MPEESDLLMVIAQLAVAFAGFASLATALSNRKHRDETRVDAGRLTNMLVVSLCTAMLALAPFIPHLFGFSDRVVWGASAAGALLLLVSFAPATLLRTQRMSEYTGFNVPTNVLNVGLAVVAAAGFAACALGLPAFRPSASYVAGLVALLLVCALVFFRVISSLLRPVAPE